MHFNILHPCPIGVMGDNLNKNTMNLEVGYKINNPTCYLLSRTCPLPVLKLLITLDFSGPWSESSPRNVSSIQPNFYSHDPLLWYTCMMVCANRESSSKVTRSSFHGDTICPNECSRPHQNIVSMHIDQHWSVTMGCAQGNWSRSAIRTLIYAIQ